MKIKALTVAAALVLLAGCRAAPIMNVTEAPVVVASNKAVTAEDVRSFARAEGSAGK